MKTAVAELVSLATPYPEPGRTLTPLDAVFGGANLSFEGDGYTTLQRITHELIDHSLKTGGPTRSTVPGWLAYTCRGALDQGIDTGFAELEDLIEELLREWTVVEHVRGHFTQAPLRVGRSVVHLTLESVPQVEEQSGMAGVLDHETPPPMLATTAHARDQESARVRVRDQFDETRSILHLIGEHIDGNARSSSGTDEGFVVIRLSFYATMTLGYRGLEAGAAKEPPYRNDWETRVLAAARWLRRCFANEWPSERVAAAMSALE